MCLLQTINQQKASRKSERFSNNHARSLSSFSRLSCGSVLVIYRPARDHGRLPGKTAGYVGSELPLLCSPPLARWFMACVAIGGWLGDKVLGTKRVSHAGALSCWRLAITLIGELPVMTPLSSIWVWRPSPSVTACLKPTRPPCFLPAMTKTTHVWTVHLPCTTCPSTSVRSSLCWQPRQRWPHVLARRRVLPSAWWGW